MAHPNTFSQTIARAAQTALRLRTLLSQHRDLNDQDAISTGVASLLRNDKDIESDIQLVLSLPRQRSKDSHQLAIQISSFLYPAHADSTDDGVTAICHYERDVTMLRRRVVAIRSTAQRIKLDLALDRKTRQTIKPWPGPMIDPVSVPAALPMPVRIATAEELEPFFCFLRSNKAFSDAVTTESPQSEPGFDTQYVEYTKGSMFEDARMDLCKMVVGPTHIGSLMKALVPNTRVRHFLLGNNIIGPVGAQQIADYVTQFPDRVTTWYLAGNCIDAKGIGLLVEAFKLSRTIEALWLKRNPLGYLGVASIARWLAEPTCSLCVLDLDQTEMQDEGCHALFSALTTASCIRTIYINGCGIGAKGCKAIAVYLSNPDAKLRNLYMGCNAIGDEGARNLADGLRVNQSLLRISIRSCGINDTGAIAITEALTGHPALCFLDLGQSHATRDLDQRNNCLTDASLPSLVRLVQEGSKAPLQSLQLGATLMTPKAFVEQLVQGIKRSAHILHFVGSPNEQENGKFVFRRGKSGLDAALLRNVRAAHSQPQLTYSQWLKEHLRALMNDEDIRTIDSIYRTRDMKAAMRGEIVLNKWWDEGDETLSKIAALSSQVADCAELR